MITTLLPIVILLLLSACFEGAEAAFLSASEVRIGTLAAKGDRRAQLVERLKRDVRLLLGTLLLGQTLCDVAASAMATVLATAAFGDAGVGIVTGFLTLVVLIFVNLIPKAYAAHHAELVSMLFARPVHLLMRLLSPFVRLVDRFVLLFVRPDPAHDRTPISEDEIKTLTAMGVSAGTVAKSEKELIERVFLFHDITANDVMTPAENIVALAAASTLADALPLVIASKFSRFPVFEDRESNIVGIVHSKNVLEKLAAGERPADAVTVKEAADRAIFVPATKTIDRLLRDFQKEHLHQAIVVNEYGTVVGLVTLEDLIEELVGQISDESDVDEHVIKRVDKHTILVHGDIQVSDVNRFFNTKIQAPEHKTVGWVILKKLGSIPAAGQKVMLAEGLAAAVEQMDKRRIVKVRLTKEG